MGDFGPVPSADEVQKCMLAIQGKYEEFIKGLQTQIADLQSQNAALAAMTRHSVQDRDTAINNYHQIRSMEVQFQERQKHVAYLETQVRVLMDLLARQGAMAPAAPIVLQASPEAIERLLAAQSSRALGPDVSARSATDADVAILQEDLRRARFTIVELQRQVQDLQGRPKHFDEGRGLYEKFEVRRTNGSSEPGCKHHGCRYFVLDYSHDPFAPVALCAYASACQSSHPQLATEILDLFSNETIKKSTAVPVRSATEADAATLREALHQARMTNQRLQKEVDSLEKHIFSLDSQAQADQSLISTQADQLAELQNRVHELETDARKWYRADGSFQLLDSAQEVVDRRIAAARALKSGKLLFPPETSDGTVSDRT